MAEEIHELLRANEIYDELSLTACCWAIVLGMVGVQRQPPPNEALQPPPTSQWIAPLRPLAARVMRRESGSEQT